MYTSDPRCRLCNYRGMDISETKEYPFICTINAISILDLGGITWEIIGSGENLGVWEFE